jgi:ABC-type transport system involved in multi-copper enzyme maturation permease subunit
VHKNKGGRRWREELPACRVPGAEARLELLFSATFVAPEAGALLACRQTKGISMNPLIETWLILGRELRRNFRSVKGIVLLILSLLGGGALALLNALGENMQKKQLAQLDSMDANMKGALKLDGLQAVYGEELGTYLNGAPNTLLVVASVSILFSPLLCSLLGFDTISSDVQHRTVRYWTVRSSRLGYVFGKFLGLWATVAVVTTLIHLVVWGVCMAMNVATAGDTVTWGGRFLFSTIMIAGAWSALVTLISSIFRLPMVSLLVSCACIFSLFMVKLVVKWFETQNSTQYFVRWVYPNNYDDLLFSNNGKLFGLGVVGIAVFVVLFMGTTTALFTKRDV